LLWRRLLPAARLRSEQLREHEQRLWRQRELSQLPSGSELHEQRLRLRADHLRGAGQELRNHQRRLRQQPELRQLLERIQLLEQRLHLHQRSGLWRYLLLFREPGLLQQRLLLADELRGARQELRNDRRRLRRYAELRHRLPDRL
jgi:hypothetical protein